MSSKSEVGVQVAVRFRPRNEREKNEESVMTERKEGEPERWSFKFAGPGGLQTVKDGAKHDWTFDHVFPPDSPQDEVYATTAKRCIDDVLVGFNATIFAYGQTGSGKTWTMFGVGDGDTKGVIPRSCAHIFDHIEADTEPTVYSVKCSFVEIYKEQIRDLLTNTKENLRVRQSPEKGIYVQGAMEEFCSSQEEVLATISLGELSRTTASTKMNAKSSRSHSVFSIDVEQQDEATGKATKKAKLVFIDLAGSERIEKTGAQGNTLEEAKKINQSLTCLGNVIKAITENSSYVPYRDSVLTRLLEESLQGNTKTTLFITCSPSPFNADETVSSLRFGSRVKTIKTEVKINRIRGVEELEAQLADLVASLKAERTYNSRLARLVEYLKSPAYDRTKPIPQEYLAVRPKPQISDDLAAEEQKPSQSATPRRASSASSLNPLPQRRHTPQQDEDPTEVLQLRIDIEQADKDTRLEVSQLEADLSDVRDTIAEHRRELEDISKLIGAAAVEREKEEMALKELVATQQKQRNHLSAQKTKLGARSKELQEKLKSLADRASELQARANEGAENISALRSEAHVLREEVGKLLAEKAAGKAELDALSAQLRGKELKIQEATRELASLHRDVADLKSQGLGGGTSREQASLAASVQTAKAEVEGFEKTCIEKQKEVVECQRQLKELREEHHKMLKDSSDRVLAMQYQLAKALTFETRLFTHTVGNDKEAIKEMTALQKAMAEHERAEGKAAADKAGETELLLCGLKEELDSLSSCANDAQNTWEQAFKEANAASLSSEEEELARRRALGPAALLCGSAAHHVDKLRSKADRLKAERSEAEKAAKALEDQLGQVAVKAAKAKEALASLEAREHKSASAKAAMAEEWKQRRAKISEGRQKKRALVKTMKDRRDETQTMTDGIYELQQKEAELVASLAAAEQSVVELKKKAEECSNLRELTVKTAEATSALSQQIQSSRRVWVPPQAKAGATMLDAYKDKVDISARASSLRPTLFGSFILEAAREEHTKSMSTRGAVSPSSTPGSRPASRPTSPGAVEDTAHAAEFNQLIADASFTVGSQKPSVAELKMYEQLFKSADKDGNGCIDVDELYSLMQKLGKCVCREEVEELVNDIDLDGNGTIEFLEFLRGMDRINDFFSKHGTVEQDLAALTEKLAAATAESAVSGDRTT